eukprot:jgi/Psemu1/201549/e_gw1.281.66.1
MSNTNTSNAAGGGGGGGGTLHVTERIADRRAARELAEARASGAIAPAVDIHTNKIINPHNPEFITKRPWYLGNNDEGPSLDHQAPATLAKSGGTDAVLSLSAADELVSEKRRKEQLKRKQQRFEPRIRMTKTGTRALTLNTADAKETYDAKRDKYMGYDADSHTKKVEAVFREREQIRKKLREEQKLKQQQQQQQQQAQTGDNAADGATNNNNNKNNNNDALSDMDSDVDSDAEGDSNSDESGDEFVQKEEKLFTTRLARQGGVGGAQMKVTARNLRIREDTAKYLRNLDTNSAYYDPKSRSMRDNPNPEVAPEESRFAGDNFARISGDAVKLAETQLFAWDAASKGGAECADLHPQANPSQAELMKTKFKSKSAEISFRKKKRVLDKYGGQEYLDGSGGLAGAIAEKKTPGAQANTAEERKIRFGVSMAREEYSRDGRMLTNGSGSGKSNQSGNHKMVAQASKYEEDVFSNGHTTVWGSYFHVGAWTWGYADDHSLMKSSYCTGAVGRQANDEANEMQYGTGLAGSAALAQARGMFKAQSTVGGGGGAGRMDPPPSRSRLYGEADPKAQLDPVKVKAALDKLEADNNNNNNNNNNKARTTTAATTTKRKYNSMNAEADVTEEEMEAYRLKKEVRSDPMAKISSDELLDYK